MDAVLSRIGSRSWNRSREQKVATAIARIEQGNLSNVKTVGGGVLEYKIDFGPG
jgi:putative component of toxin-antitoxin plasmid stabilization module